MIEDKSNQYFGHATQSMLVCIDHEYIFLWGEGERLWKLYYISDDSENKRYIIHHLANNEKTRRAMLISGLIYIEKPSVFTVTLYTLKEFDRYMHVLGVICDVGDIRYNRGQVELFYDV